MKTVFVDSDIILDLFLAREQRVYSLALFQLCFEQQCNLVTTPIVIANVHYISIKQLNVKIVIENLKKLKKVIRLIHVSDYSFAKALDSDFSDFEDALQYFAAFEAKVDYIITRNKKDYKKSKIPVLTAEEFIKRENI